MGFRDGNFVLAAVRERLRAACESTGSSDLWWWDNRAAFAVRHADQSSLTRRKLQLAINLLSDTKATSEPQPCDELLCDDPKVALKAKYSGQTIGRGNVLKSSFVTHSIRLRCW